MRDLVTKIGRFCEAHVEKIVLVMVSVICVWLFFTRVIFSPNAVPLDNRDFSPGQIDRYIHEQKAQELRANLQQQKTAAAKPYRSPLTGSITPNDAIVAGLFDRPLARGFLGLFNDPLGFINAVSVPKPAPLPADRMYASRRYRLPLIPDVTNVGVNYIRAAAYVPLEEITAQMTYDKAPVEPNDIDLVTVEAKFDVAELYRRFHASFAGVDVQKEEWRDPCLADPVFAAVQLERQHLQEDGTWSNWQDLPRTRVEPHQKLFTVVEKMEDLPPGGLEVRLMQFDGKPITMELLQPESYQIASAEEDWFPPSFHGKFKLLQRKLEMEERQKQREDAREQSDRTVDGRRDGTTRGGGGAYGGTQTGRASRGMARNQAGTTGDSLYGPQRGGRATGRADQGAYATPGGRARPTRRGQAPGEQMYDDAYAIGMSGVDGRRKTTDEVYLEFGKELINYRTDLSKLDKPLLIWVFDDTAGPGRTYRYRMRVGVFNPVAGTSQLVERDVDKKDRVILWSAYSDVTEPVEVRNMLYLFAKDAQERTKTATVEVARYALGYWRTEDFQVKLGEAIGKEVEPKPEKTPARTLAGRITGPRGDNLMMAGAPVAPGGLGMTGTTDYAFGTADQTTRPTTVDYTTGKVLVDLVQVSDLGGTPNLRARTYHDMLYTADGTHIEHMPVSTTNWPENLLQTYQYILSEKRREPQPFRAFNKGGLRGRGRRGGMPGMEGYPDMGGAYEGMMDMGGEGAYGPYP